MKLMVKISLLISLMLYILSTSSCNEDEPRDDQIINPLWKKRFDVGFTTGIDPVVYGDIVIYSMLEEKTQDLSANEILVGYDKKTGEETWSWNDHFEPTYQHFPSNSLKPIYEGVMAVTIGGRNFAINISNGETVWKNRNDHSTSRSDLVNLDHKLFRTDIGDLEFNGEYVERIMETDFSTGDWHQVFEVRGGDSIRQGLEVPSFYFEGNGDTVMIFTNTQHNQIRNVIVPRLISYNKTKQQVYYDTLLDEPSIGNAVDWFPIIDGDKVFISVDDMMVCHNIQTAERIWKRQLNANILSSNFILVDGRIYSNTEEPALWCLDADKGFEIWKIPSYGFSSYLNYYNGQIIYVGGGLLRIIDAASGNVLAEIRAPSSYDDDNDFFSGRCTVDPETGNIYVVSQSTAYCYPPYRR